MSLTKLFWFYLPFSYRAIIYASTAHFARVFASALDDSIPRLTVLFYILNSAFYEIVQMLTQKHYRPKFYLKGSPEAFHTQPKPLLLNREEYDFRTKQEVYLSGAFIYFLLNFILSSLVCLISQNYVPDFIYATLGSVIFLFNFFGSFLMSFATNNKSSPVLFICLAMGLVFHWFGWVYAFGGLARLGFSLGHSLFSF